LDVAKIESGELPVEKKAFDLHDALSGTIKIFYESARKKNILLCAYIDPSLPNQITSDPYRIKQVLSNLLSNAIKFTPENGSILIDAVYDTDTDIVTIGVEDTGIGIKKESLNDIFVAYRQESASTEKEYGGTGLGLNISYQIVALLGGRLQVKSEEGKGSRFSFDLPAPSRSTSKKIVDKLHCIREYACINGKSGTIFELKQLYVI
jgi:signal transduction histidine kinase